MLEKGLCKGCGKEIYWAKTAKGATVPLDARALVFKVSNRSHETTAEPIKQLDEFTHLMVSHFATCPQARTFSQKSKKR